MTEQEIQHAEREAFREWYWQTERSEKDALERERLAFAAGFRWALEKQLKGKP